TPSPHHPSPRQAHTLTCSLSHTHSLTHSFSLTHSHTLTHILSLSHTHSRSVSHTYSHTLSLTHSLCLDSFPGEDIEITFSYWDGSGHRKTVKMKKGNTIQQFLQKGLEILRKDFSELRYTFESIRIYSAETG
uniref:FAM50A/XAP5 C-terminal domain-containing protein n=1 Tax=Callorhinchus milii TaxID=7868 RepID=A0A4W3GEJ0_CALMI